MSKTIATILAEKQVMTNKIEGIISSFLNENKEISLRVDVSVNDLFSIESPHPIGHVVKVNATIELK